MLDFSAQRSMLFMCAAADSDDLLIHRYEALPDLVVA